tara:strand:- start:135 stop:635 length:501 start_codon:yes stop_codon:yes gene_type:complete
MQSSISTLIAVAAISASHKAQSLPLPETATSSVATENTAPFDVPTRITQTLITNRERPDPIPQQLGHGDVRPVWPLCFRDRTRNAGFRRGPDVNRGVCASDLLKIGFVHQRPSAGPNPSNAQIDCLPVVINPLPDGICLAQDSDATGCIRGTGYVGGTTPACALST